MESEIWEEQFIFLGKNHLFYIVVGEILAIFFDSQYMGELSGIWELIDINIVIKTIGKILISKKVTLLSTASTMRLLMMKMRFKS